MLTLDLKTFELDNTINQHVPYSMSDFIITHSCIKSSDGGYEGLAGHIKLYGSVTQTVVDHFNNTVPLLKANKGVKNPKPMPSFLVLLISRAVLDGLNIHTTPWTFSTVNIRDKAIDAIVTTSIKVPVKNKVPARLGKTTIERVCLDSFDDLATMQIALKNAEDYFNSSLERFNTVMSQIKQAYEDIQK
jgi:hypothetical protein